MQPVQCAKNVTLDMAKKIENKTERSYRCLVVQLLELSESTYGAQVLS